MRMEQKFQKAYEALEEKIRIRSANKRYTALGYTSNLDLLCEFHAEKLNVLLESHLQGKDLTKMQAAKMITTTEELLESMVYYCIRGIGGEVDIEDAELAKRLFPFRNGMGGTAVQAALALAQLGAASVVHLTDDSKEVCDQLISPYIRIPLDNGMLGGADLAEHKNPQEVHLIIQFKKGDLIRLGDQSIEIPCSNRLILTKNTVNEYLPLSEAYLTWIEDHAKQVTTNVLSSFNCILELDILKERLTRIKQHVELYHRNNPAGIVYFEDAHYHNAEVKKVCAETIYPSVDILSMNEEELQYTLKEMYGYEVDIDEIDSCVEGACFLIRKFEIKKGVIVHTKDYAMYVGDPGIADMERGLMYGSMLATAKAMNGGYGTWEQIKEVLRLPLSEKGVLNLRKLEESKYADHVILIPTCYMDKPQYTIGLGDSFTGGVQMCF